MGIMLCGVPVCVDTASYRLVIFMSSIILFIRLPLSKVALNPSSDHDKLLKTFECRTDRK